MAAGSVDVALAMDATGEDVWAAWAVTVAGRITLYPPHKLASPEGAAEWLLGAGGDGRRLGFHERRGRSRLLVETGNSFLHGVRLARLVAGGRAWSRYQPAFVWLALSDTPRPGYVIAADGLVSLGRRELEAAVDDEFRHGGTVQSEPDRIVGRWTADLRPALYAPAKKDEPDTGLRISVQLAVWSAVEHAARAERAAAARLAWARP